MENYHQAPFYTAAAAKEDSKNKALSQYRLAKAIFRERALRESLREDALFPNDLLAKSKQFIRQWSKGITEEEKAVLQRSNGEHYVTVWTKQGPQLWLKSRTVGACRITNKLYYTADFENLVVAAALMNKGRMNQIRDYLRARWVESDDAVATLLCSNVRVNLREVLSHIFTATDGMVQKTLAQFKQRAATRGEWISVSHDGTFKALFSLVGHKKMSQQAGGLHVAHTFLGITGACPGFSPQTTEGTGDFLQAVDDLFTPAMCAQVRFLFSDRPSEGMLGRFPNAVGVAEDLIHLVLRCEYCSAVGGRPVQGRCWSSRRSFSILWHWQKDRTC